MGKPNYRKKQNAIIDAAFVKSEFEFLEHIVNHYSADKCAMLFMQHMFSSNHGMVTPFIFHFKARHQWFADYLKANIISVNKSSGANGENQTWAENNHEQMWNCFKPEGR